MNGARIGLGAGLGTLVLAGAIQASGQATPAPAAAGPWLHVRVEEPRQQKKVAVNLPLSVVEVALERFPDKPFSMGRFHLEHGRPFGDVEIADLRRMWAELKTSGDAELVSVEERDKSVRIAREGGLVLIRVENSRGGESVKIDVPTQVVDALLSGEGRELNVRAALAEMQKRRGDIVRVNESGKTVRIWIDESK
jgi:hypothetical protein